ncbi:ATP-binding protein [bacterium]|nr:ATP-binding protein [bacterium]
MQNKSTYLGTIQDVNGTTVGVTLSNESLSGLTYVDGEGYRIGQIGSFVKIPIGYIDLFGVVTQVGASAVPENKSINQPYGNRWLTIQLIGEGQRTGKFERGISQYPTIGDEVHLVSENDLRKIYGQPSRPYFVKVGHIAGAESISALVDVNKLVTRHSAVVGTTGAGKSTTVAGIISALSDSNNYPSSRIIILDIHGEYGQAFKGKANIFRVNANVKSGENELYLPFWALNFEELSEISFGSFNTDKDRNIVLERILEKKRASVAKYKLKGVTSNNLNVDAPIPFSLNHLWYELYTETLGKYYAKKPGNPKDNIAYETDLKGVEIKGDPLNAIPPIFKKINTNSANGQIVNYLPDTLNIGQQLQALGAKLRVPRYDFIFKPGDWLPKEDGQITKDLDKLFQSWVGSDKPITILDLSGVPIDILNTIVGIVLRIMYEGMFWARRLSQGGRERPLLIVMEEAHNYLNDNFKGLASTVVQRIVKEGRKYGIGAMIVSQRPSEINSTILSQCGTFFAMRLANATDRGHITAALPDNLDGLTNMLPILRTGEAIIVGEAVKLPMRTLIEVPPKDKRPDSQDPTIYSEEQGEKSQQPGGWGIPMEPNPNFEEFVEVWRGQNPLPSRVFTKEKGVIKSKSKQK